MIYITSDLHFFHKNMTQEGKAFVKKRAHFETVEEMNKALIEAHNKVITEKDEVYILGDIALTTSKEGVAETVELIKQLKGHLYIVKGNHDSSKLMNALKSINYITQYGKYKYTFEEVGFRIKYDKMILHLSHYALMTGGRGRLFSVHGHIHEYASNLPYAINVCVDSPELPEGHPFGEPLPIDVVCELLRTKQENAVDPFLEMIDK